MLDDSLVNLAPAFELGMTTVLVKPLSDGSPYVHHSLPSLLSLPLALPELWDLPPDSHPRSS